MTAVHRGSALRSLAVSLAGVRSGRADTFLTIEIGAHTFDYKMGAVEIDGTGETHYGAAGLKTAHEAVACSWRSDNPDGFHKRLWGVWIWRSPRLGDTRRLTRVLVILGVPRRGS
jgi:hypothetical protein